jgi:hypothetical protein
MNGAPNFSIAGEDPVPDLPISSLDLFGQAVELANATAVAASKSTELVLGTDDASHTKSRLALAHSDVARKAQEATELYERARQEIEDTRLAMNRRIREIEAQMEPVRKIMARLQDGIGAVNLYLGRDEHIEELRGGSSAAPGTALHIRQQVLAMDEESALSASGGGIDFKQIDKFTGWLMESAANLDQVIPDQLGVVAIMPRRTPVNYSDNAMVNANMNAENFKTWWLIRNGERLYLMTTDFAVGVRLIPERNEFTDMFTVRRNGVVTSMEPGSREWLVAEARADIQTRHYMKVALILQGLVDRTAVFHPLPEGGLNLLSEAEYESGRVILIADDELAIGTGRPSFADFQEERIGALDVGMRIVGYFGRGDDAVHPQHANPPKALDVHTLTRGDANYLYFAYERTDTVYRANFDYGPAKNRATYRIDRNDFRGASYVSIDNITVDEIEHYLGSRSERHAYKTLFPALQVAAEVIKAEDAAEFGFRELLGAAFVAEALSDVDEAESLARELITWWKTANKWHRALNGEPDHERKAQSAILREARRRQQAVNDSSVFEAVRLAVPKAMVIAARTNDIIAVESMVRRFPAAAAAGNVWVRIHEFTPRGKFRTSTDWKTLTRAQVAKWTIWESTPEWESWKLNPVARHHLTDDAIESVLENVRAALAAREVSVLKYHEDDKNDRVQVTAYFKSEIDSSGGKFEFRQGSVTFTVNVADGVGQVPIRELGHRTPRPHSWGLSSPLEHDGKPRVWEAPHTVRFFGTADSRCIVWTDETVLAADAKELIVFEKKNEERMVVSRRQQELYKQIESGWKVADEQGRYERFMEDFADDSLWADHKKTQPVAAFPVRRTAHDYSNALTDIIGPLVDASHEVAGVSVRDAAALVGVTVGRLPDGVLDICFVG